MIPSSWLTDAARRIAPHILTTPLTYDEAHDLYLKWDNRQVTGSFKVRGALNKILSLQDWERDSGLVAASAGNHGAGVAFAAGLVGAKATIFASDHAVPAKVDAMRALGAEVRLVPGGYGEAEAAGIAYAKETESIWVSPYNDGQIIAGQGTLALEALEQLPPLFDLTWIVPVGGGGLIAGVSSALQSVASTQRTFRVVGVQTEASAFMHSLYHRGSQEGVADLETLADGLAGPVERGSITVPMVRTGVDELLLVGEAEVAEAMAYAWRTHGERIEGSAAVALAAALRGKVPGRPAIVLLTGGNVQPETFQKVTSIP